MVVPLSRPVRTFPRKRVVHGVPGGAAWPRAVMGPGLVLMRVGIGIWGLATVVGVRALPVGPGGVSVGSQVVPMWPDTVRRLRLVLWWPRACVGIEGRIVTVMSKRPRTVHGDRSRPGGPPTKHLRPWVVTGSLSLIPSALWVWKEGRARARVILALSTRYGTETGRSGGGGGGGEAP